mgnify:CR=1 FL=1
MTPRVWLKIASIPQKQPPAKTAVCSPFADSAAGGSTGATSLRSAVFPELLAMPQPTATTTKQALALYTLAKKAGVKHGVVQDKLWLPGLLKLKMGSPSPDEFGAELLAAKRANQN